MNAKPATKKSLFLIVIVIWIVVCLGAIALAALVFTGVVPSPLSALPGIAESEIGAEMNEVAPYFELQDLSGNTVRLSDLRGKIVVLNFWATWCIPCVEEMPLFQSFQENFPEIVVLGINEEEDLQTVKEFVEKMDFHYTFLLDQKTQVAKLYRVMMLPSTYFIDETGILRFRHIGVISEPQFEIYLFKLGLKP